MTDNRNGKDVNVFMEKFEKIFNAVVGQSGGPTCAINATLAGVIKSCMDSDKIGTVYGMKNGIEGLLKDELIPLDGYFKDSEQLSLLCSTPAAALGSCRVKISDDGYCEKISEVLEKHDIRYFFYIGGNDSMDAVEKLAKYQKENPRSYAAKVKFIGVPKTIDNDLCGTDHTPGFGSAAKFIACSVAEIARDCAVYAQKAVTIIEVMGRDAGWLTASAALAKHIGGVGADLIYLPEVPFDSERFIEDVKDKLDGGEKPYVIVAVSEGIKSKDGEYTAKSGMSGVKDIFGHAYLAGTGKYLENLVREKIGCKCRSVELSVLQRCASHIASATDIDESFLIGRKAVEAALVGKNGRMMTFVRTAKDGYGVEISDEDVSVIANKAKHVPPSFISDDGKNVSGECIEYLLPLICGERHIKYEKGLPVHFSF